MSITVPVSLGELLDKISILLIKKINIKDQKKLTYITKELNQLNDILEKSNLKIISANDLSDAAKKIVEATK